MHTILCIIFSLLLLHRYWVLYTIGVEENNILMIVIVMTNKESSCKYHNNILGTSTFYNEQRMTFVHDIKIQPTLLKIRIIIIKEKDYNSTIFLLMQIFINDIIFYYIGIKCSTVCIMFDACDDV